MTYPLVTDLQRDGVPVALACRVLGFSKQAYYKWRSSPVTDREWDDAHLINAAMDVHADDPAFGYRLITDELNDQGLACGESRMQRLCSQEGILSATVKRKGLARKAGPPAHDDLVLRDFSAPRPDELWLADITEHPTAEGKLYACAIVDAFSKRVVGWSVSDRMTAALAVSALRMAIMLRDPTSTTLHTDRGSQFRARSFTRMLAGHGLRGSMGRVGACGDNAAMESFFSLLQKNVLDAKRWATRAELRSAIITWVERTYNRRRRQRGLRKLTPVEYEAVHSAKMAA